MAICCRQRKKFRVADATYEVEKIKKIKKKKPKATKTVRVAILTTVVLIQ